MGTFVPLRKSTALHLFTFLLLLLPATASQECGSLVTYRQHADLLQTAPKCLREGCTARQNATTISSPCPRSSPCFVYWNMFVEQFDQKHSWCSDCASDLACRIGNWPVLNATAFCDLTPNELLFGGEGEGCCIKDDEPFQLADWTGRLCNGSEWREPFDKCGGMACQDWREWVVPWNWTIQNSLVPPDKQECTPPHKYLAVYMIEQLFWLACSLGIGYLRLRIAQHEEKTNKIVVRYWMISIWQTIIFKQTGETVEREGEHLRPSWTDKLAWGFPVIMGVFMAGVELGFNFLAAYLIQREDGYHHIRIWRLALLFCCRPRLSWLSCLLSLLPDRLLVKIFKFRENGDGLWAAKLVLSSVAVTSAVTEAIMQLLGAYFLGKTAQIGAERGFYYIHHLRPKMHGRDARHMYLGALFWLMLCIPLLIVWFVVAMFFTQVYFAVADWRKKIYNFLRPKAESIPKPLAQGAVIWILDHIDPDPTPPATRPSRQVSMRGGGGYEQVIPVDSPSNQPIPVDTSYDPPMSYGGSGSSDLFNSDSQPIPYNRTSRMPRSPYSPLSQSQTQQEMDDQIMPVMPRAASGSGFSRTPLGAQRRAPSGGNTAYSSLPEHEGDDDDDGQLMPIPLNSSNQRLHTRAPEMSEAGRQTGHGSYSALSRTTPGPYQSTNDLVPPSTSGEGSGSGSSRRRQDFNQGVSWKWAHWESKIVFAGFSLGLLAFASQWLFWDGFVKAQGDRFCPPKAKIFDVGATWWAGSLIYVGLPFLGY
ncbi:hypothetical protein BCR34DRAFT_552636 [Clohesyomyces aquaticus]|uniref:Uncharacterized protein n=1 Tax=Clohesyomyces aquaticus TaxID=1231657 RepID=A0A1Y2AA08_9PLEO|nr:hypothetical protein BCR34DRAFT_552636 [Clohesyomyces aquaticus]